MNSQWKVKYVPKTDSSHSTLKDLLLSGEGRAGAVLVAREQNAGHGRLNRQWFSPLGNLALSLSLAPPQGFESKSYQYNLVTALALQELLQKDYQQTVQIKWPNDIYLSGKKLSGILSENLKGPEGALIIIGIGLNLNTTTSDFPEDLRERLTTLRDATGHEHDLEIFVKRLLTQLESLIKLYHQRGFAPIKSGIEENLLWRGEKIFVQEKDQEEIHGICEGLDEDGFLLLRDDSGCQKRILAGDVLCYS